MDHYLIRSLLKIAIGLFFLAIGLLVGLTGLICYPYRLLVLALSKIFRPDLVDFVRGAANITFVFGSDTVPVANICVCLTFDGVITVEEFRKRFQKNILHVCRPDGSRPYDKLKQTITKFMNFAFYRWVEDFNLNEHVRPYDYEGPLALPINEGVTEEDIQRIAGKLISLPYAPGKSHWEFLIVENFIPASTGDRKTLLLLRMSHALADGYSIQGLLFALTDTPDLAVKFEQPSQNSKSNIWIKLWNMTLLPGKILWDAGTQALDLMIDQCSWKIQRHEGENAENMAVFTKAVHVDVIKAIKNIYHVSYASVLLAALSTSIYRAMKESGQRIPNKMYCILPAPKPNHPGGVTNHVLASFLPLPIVPHASPSSIVQINAHLQKVINTKANVLSELILEMNAFLPLFLAENIYCTMNTSAAVGIFPVVSQRVAIDGKLLSDGITFVACLAGPTTNGATVSMGGVNNLQRISICMDKRAFSNEEIFCRLAGYIEDEIDRMKESLSSHKKSSLSGSADIKKRA